MNIYIYIYVHTCTYTHTYIHTYIHILYAYQGFLQSMVIRYLRLHGVRVCGGMWIQRAKFLACGLKINYNLRARG